MSASNPLDDVRALEPRTLAQVAAVARPAWRPDPFTDPETSALRASFKGILDIASGSSAENTPAQTAERRIRVVGEEFFPTR